MFYSQAGEQSGVIKTKIFCYAMGKVVCTVSDLVCKLGEGKRVFEVGVHIGNDLVQNPFVCNTFGELYL